MWLIQFMTWAVRKNLHIYSVKKLTMDAEGYDISSLKNKSFFKVSKKICLYKKQYAKKGSKYLHSSGMTNKLVLFKTKAKWF